LFTFDDIEGLYTNVYVIRCKDYYFVCDTYLGPEPMNKIKKLLFKNFGEKQFIVFNSHYHWDHIWGNCAFPNSLIISHSSTVNMINLYGESELFSNKEYKKGDVKIVKPNMVFRNTISFPDENIILFYSPGHTFDSASLYDMLDRVLYVGDNIEEPITSLENKEFDQYVETLKKYENLDFKVLIPGHMLSEEDLPKQKVIKKNMKYLTSIMDQTGLSTYQRKQYRDIHRTNLENLEKIGYVPIEK
jgi:glyoxylase-like metal-dependent hydrolase (beta-lactamase superfamily II)